MLIKSQNRIIFSIKSYCTVLMIHFLVFGLVSCDQKKLPEKPNILFCIADDWGWPHAGVYGDRSVHTPNFDRLATAGLLFENAFVSSPSCTPSRGAILTGQHFWRLGEGANLWSTLSADIPTYPLILEQNGYYVGSWRKAWGPGDLKAGGYQDKRPAGKNYPKGFGQFLSEKPEGKPFCFWLGASDPHRGYQTGSGEASGINLEKIELPKFYPEVDTIRSDLADYYFEVNRFDRDIGNAIQLLDSIGELDNTVIVVTGDHGMPFPRCKGNLYDMGVRVPLVISWGKNFDNRRISDLVSLTDLAPTFIELAGVEVPEIMTGKSLMSLLKTDSKDLEGSHYEQVVFGRERHVPAQSSPSMNGYPSRGIRTNDYLYIHNFFPDRWPAGVPDGASHPMNSFADCDNGPTKTFLIEHKDQSEYAAYYQMSFEKRPLEELYDIRRDPDQLVNLVDRMQYQPLKDSLANQLFQILSATDDPRVVDKNVRFDSYPYRAPYLLNEKKTTQ